MTEVSDIEVRGRLTAEASVLRWPVVWGFQAMRRAVARPISDEDDGLSQCRNLSRKVAVFRPFAGNSSICAREE